MVKASVSHIYILILKGLRGQVRCSGSTDWKERSDSEVVLVGPEVTLRLLQAGGSSQIVRTGGCCCSVT